MSLQPNSGVILLPAGELRDLVDPASALAAKYGARAHSRIAALIGCGMQARYQLAAFRAVFSLEEVRLYDIDPAKAEDFAKMAGELCRPVETVSEALEGADICITCTTA